MLEFCNTPHVTCHICNSDSCHFRLCVMFFPPLSGFCLSFCILSCHAFSYHVIMCIAFAYVFVSCIRAFSPLSILLSGTPMSSGVPFYLFSCAGIKHSRIGPRLVMQIGLLPVDRLSCFVPFGLRLILQWLTEGP